MIFAAEGHIDMIRNGLFYASRGTFPESISLSTLSKKSKRDIEPIVKTQTRRLNRGIYQVGGNYAVQRKRGIKADPDIRIVMDRIWEEEAKQFLVSAQGVKYPCEIYITNGNALAEGNYTPARFEGIFRDLNPNWDGWRRWAFEFHAIEVQR